MQHGVKITMQRYQMRHKQRVQLAQFETVLHEINAALDALTVYHQQCPQHQIALIVPDLPQWQRYIDAELAAKANDMTWRFSLAPKLTEHSLIQTALQLLQLPYQQFIHINELQFLFRSPYWSVADIALSERTHFIAQCQALALQEISWDVLLDLAKHSLPLEQLLFQWRRGAVKKNQSLAAWSEHWQETLIALNFTAPVDCNDQEQRVMQQWQVALQHLTLLLPWLKDFDFKNAYRLLQQQCQMLRYTPYAAQQKPMLQILGVLEALDEKFDMA
jgi:hypothetical protein